MSKTVFFDLETTGVDTNTVEITQIAAVAVDTDYNEIASFSRLVRFDVQRADPKALEINHFDAERWAKEAIGKGQALAEFFTWAKPHLDQARISKTSGRPYYVGTLCGYNAASFDGPILKRVAAQHSGGRGMFVPFDPRVRDALQVALSVCDFLGITLKDYKLATVAEHFGAPVEKSHDALSDVRTTVALMRRFRDIFVSANAAA